MLFLIYVSMDEKIIESIIQLEGRAKNIIEFVKVVFYGSYSRSDNTIDSDIDVAFVVDGIKGNYLDVWVKLFELADKIDNRIEPIILNKKNDRSGYLAKILREGKIIYST